MNSPRPHPLEAPKATVSLLRPPRLLRSQRSYVHRTRIWPLGAATLGRALRPVPIVEMATSSTEDNRFWPGSINGARPPRIRLSQGCSRPTTR